MMPDEKLRVLVYGAGSAEDRALFDLLKSRPEISRMTMLTPSDVAAGWQPDGVTTIFIDPIGLGLGEASDFILGVLKDRAEISFVLFLDPARGEADEQILYRGDRAAFRSFPVLDKTAPAGDIAAGLEPLLRGLRSDRRRARTQAEADEVVTRAREIAASGPGEEANALVEELEKAMTPVGADPPAGPRRVFLSYRFDEPGYVDGLKELLRDAGFEVVTAEDANTSISTAVVDRIRLSDFFLSLMTRAERLEGGDWMASLRVIEEKVVALTLEKYVVLLVEEDVTGIGGLHGGWQQHRFKPKEFTSAALKAVRELRIAAGHHPD
jgi:hypothetical protein